MNRNDLRKVDLQLLVVFESLMHERNLTRTAEKLFLGQPAISAALTRLRDNFNDPLFVRNGRSMEPTPRASAIFQRLPDALDGISLALSEVQEFEPATSRATFRVGMSDDVQCGLLPRLLIHLRNEAPNCIVVVRPANFLLLPGLLTSGEVSVGVSYTLQLPANAKSRTLRNIKATVIRADDDTASLTLDQFCERPHALISMSGDLSGKIDHDLGLLGRSRHVALAVPHFTGLAALIRNSNLIATVPDYVADELVLAGGLIMEPPPFQIAASQLNMVWRAASDQDPAERWLRQQIMDYMSAE